MSLTLKQQKFVDEYLINGGNATEAYKHAYNTSKMKEETIWKRAGELKRNGVVSGRLQLEQKKLEDKALWTREESVKALREIMEDDEARHNDKISCVKELNSMHGFKEETLKHIGDKQNPLEHNVTFGWK